MSNDTRADDVTVRDDPDRHRFVATLDGEDVGFLVYHRAQGRHLLVHTEVDDAYEGQGVGSALVRGALDHLREAGASMVPLCPYVRSWLSRHEDYQPLVYEELDTLLRP